MKLSNIDHKKAYSGFPLMQPSLKIGSILLLAVSFALYYLTVFWPEYSCAVCGLDLKSFYDSFVAFSQGHNPYFYPVPNLNPPFFLWLFSSLSKYALNKAGLIWDTGSFLLMIAHFSIVWILLKPELKKSLDPLLILALYFLSYPVIVNGFVGQVWALISFLILLGYRFLLNQQDCLAGVLWGLAAALKLSPLFLILYLLLIGKKKAAWWTLGAFILFSMLPLLSQGAQVYIDYFAIINTVHWFSHKLNCSLFSLVFSLSPGFNLPLYQILHKVALILMVLSIGLYVCLANELIKRKQTDTAFCLSLTFLLIVNPISLLYSLSILLYPMLFLWNKVKAAPKLFYLWLLSFILISLPVSQRPISWEPKAIIYCDNFGLILLAYLIYHSASISISQKIFSLSKKKKALLMATFSLIFLYGQVVLYFTLLYA